MPHHTEAPKVRLCSGSRLPILGNSARRFAGTRAFRSLHAGADLHGGILSIWGTRAEVCVFMGFSEGMFRWARCQRRPDESGSIRRVNEDVMMCMVEPQKSLNLIPSF